MTLRSYVKSFNSTDVYIAWDKKLKYPCTNFRQQKMEGDYKAQRDKESAKDVFKCEEELSKITKTLGIKNIYPGIMEADDVIGWLSQRLEGDNIIISADKDLLQLIDENNSVYAPRKKVLIELKNFKENVGVDKEYFLPYKAIFGDPSDNIPGLDGYGKVRARKLAEKFVNGEKEITQDQLDLINKNIHLMDLKNGYIYAGDGEEEIYKEQFESSIDIEPDLDKFKKYCEDYNFSSFLNKFNEWEKLFKKSRLLTLLNNFTF
jgi:5'-3' exonuclease